MATSSLANSRYAGVDTVTLIVGETKTPFRIHEDLLFENSTYFKATFGSGFREGASREITLPEDETKIVDRFVHWLYSPSSYPLTWRVTGIRWEDIIKLYIFTDKYIVPNLKSCMFKEIKGARRVPSLDSVAIAYDNLPASSDLRKLLVAPYAIAFYKESKFEATEYKEKLSQMPEFAADLVCALAKLARRDRKTLKAVPQWSRHWRLGDGRDILDSTAGVWRLYHEWGQSVEILRMTQSV